jgi:hypothetical protein
MRFSWVIVLMFEYHAYQSAFSYRHVSQ